MNELTVVERSPKNEVAFGQKAAESLMHIVREKKLARKFGGEKEHLFVEAWEILGQFAGLSAVVRSANSVEIDGVKGAEAFVELVDEQGKVIGGAIALCLRDEPNWRNKPFFQLISMAQTRAVSKAFRIKLGWVASMAGYSGTPAEEMDGVHQEPTHTKPLPKGRSPRSEAPTQSGAEKQESWDSRDADLEEIRGLLKETGTNEEKVLEHYKLPSLDALDKDQAGKLLGILMDRKSAMDN